MIDRIQKVLANHGVGSRREIERWIELGDVEVDGKISVLGDKISGTEKVVVKGVPIKLITKPNAQQCLIYYKPVGVMCTRHDPEGRPTVFDHLPALTQSRWVMVGRLDYNTSGLLLFTTDGELANNLMHPSSNIEREYSVRILGTLTDGQVQRLLKGIELEDGEAKFNEVYCKQGAGVNQWVNVVLKEGRYREVRRLFEAIDISVNRLMRVRFGSLVLPRTLNSGEFTEVASKHFVSLLKGKRKNDKTVI
jgi:23S rRNA pseudouridine2605 synthase